MRYQGWDVLVFPAGNKVPIQEFKTACHVVQDHESGSIVPNSFMLPTVTCFIPSLPAGFPFRVSVHCWNTPDISRYAQSYTKHPESVMFEARIYIDGKLSGRRLFQRAGPWPTIIDTGLDRDRNGELEDLKFPNFHAELLTHHYWNAGDDLGRVKIVISEGFPRDSVTMPLERVKNVVAFSFQHAPIGVLEDSSIAWPNPGMWRHSPYNLLAQQASPQKPYEGIESHGHSPRRKAASGQASGSVPAPPLLSMFPPHVPNVPQFPRGPNLEPYYVNNGNRKVSSSSGDISMPDYSSYYLSHSNSGQPSTRNVTDPTTQEGLEPKQRRNLQSYGAYEHIYEALLPAAPANTPHDCATPMAKGGIHGLTINEHVAGPSELDPSLQLFGGDFKSRKESRPDSPHPGAILNSDSPDQGVPRRTSHHQTTNHSGSKRQRVVTPSSSKAGDEPNLLRSSPTPRKVSSPRKASVGLLGDTHNIR